MYDVIAIGTATQDVFLRSDAFRVVHDPAHLARSGFRTGYAQCLASVRKAFSRSASSNRTSAGDILK